MATRKIDHPSKKGRMRRSKPTWTSKAPKTAPVHEQAEADFRFEVERVRSTHWGRYRARKLG